MIGDTLDFLGFIGKATGEQEYNVASIFQINGEPRLLCDPCSTKAIKALQEEVRKSLPFLPEEERERLEEERGSDEIDLPPISAKFKDLLYSDELDWRYHLREGAAAQCEQCGKIII